MSRLLWLVAGLVGGVIVGRNADPMTSPAGGAVVLALLAGCGLCWVAAYRGKTEAVATAVAVAHAAAAADAEANAQAIANAAVHLHLEQLGQRVGSAVLEDSDSSTVRALDQARHEAVTAEHSTDSSSARLWVPARFG